MVRTTKKRITLGVNDIVDDEYNQKIIQVLHKMEYNVIISILHEKKFDYTTPNQVINKIINCSWAPYENQELFTNTKHQGFARHKQVQEQEQAKAVRIKIKRRRRER